LRSAWAKVSETPTSINKSDVVALICGPSYVGGIGRRTSVYIGLGKNVRPCLKNDKHQKRLGEWAVVKRLPSKLEVLSSNPNTSKKKERKKDTYFMRF
jgi:hypothetical protein